jgi:hypothetical protein
MYKQITTGLKLDAIVNSLINDLNEKSLFELLNFFFEKVKIFLYNPSCVDLRWKPRSKS